MNRRDLMKGLMALVAVVALPRIAFSDDVDQREHIYLRRGELLENRTFANHVTIQNARGSVITNCTFEDGVELSNAQDTVFSKNFVKSKRVSAHADMRYKEGREVVWEKTSEGVRWRYAA